MRERRWKAWLGRGAVAGIVWGAALSSAWAQDGEEAPVEATEEPKKDEPKKDEPKADAKKDEPKASKVSGGVGLDALITKGQEHLKNKAWDQAAATFSEALLQDPGSSPALQGLAKARTKQEKWDEAIAAVKGALDADPSWDEGLYQLGFLYRKKSKFADSIKFYKQYIEKAPDNPDAYFGLGQAYQKSDQPKKALETFRVYIEKETRPGEEKWVARAKEMIASLEQQVGEGEEAVAAVEAEEGAEEVPKKKAPKPAEEEEEAAPSESLPPGGPVEWLRLGDLAAKEENWARAGQLYQAATQKDAKRADAPYKLGVARAIQGDLPGAIEAWEEAEARDPKLALAKDNISKAKKKLETQTQKGVDDPALLQGTDAQVELAGRYLQEGRVPMALRVLEPLADREPEHGKVRYLKGRALLELGRLDEAQSELELALGRIPGEPQVWGALGWVHLRQGEQERAQYFLERYLERAQDTASPEELEAARQTVVKLKGGGQP